MSRMERQAQEKARVDIEHRKLVRRNQIIFAVLSIFLILSMVLSLVH